MGAAIAMLVTPKSGRQMREQIRDFIGEELEKIRCKCSDCCSDTHTSEAIK